MMHMWLCICLQENWKANISMIVGNRAYDYENIDILSATVKSGLRRLFSAVVKYDLYNQVCIINFTYTKFIKICALQIIHSYYTKLSK